MFPLALGLGAVAGKKTWDSMTAVEPSWGLSGSATHNPFSQESESNALVLSGTFTCGDANPECQGAVLDLALVGAGRITATSMGPERASFKQQAASKPGVIHGRLAVPANSTQYLEVTVTCTKGAKVKWVSALTSNSTSTSSEGSMTCP